MSLKRCMYACLAAWAVSAAMTGRMPPPERLHTELHHQPTRQFIQAKNFTYQYKGQSVEVVPMARVEVPALVASHNAPEEWHRFDITHDNQSANLRDLCLLWGANLKNDLYRNVRLLNEDVHCKFTLSPESADFDEGAILNTRLIAGTESMRERIAAVHAGDQIILKGMQVSYAEARMGGKFQSPALLSQPKGYARDLIVYVEELQVLDSYNSLWQHISFGCLAGFFALMATRVGLWLFTREY